MFTITFIVLVGILSIFVEAQRPDIVDEILPEVKQKNQIGYLNCTVVNKGNESVVQWSKVETVNGGNPILLTEDDKIMYQGNTGINEDSGLPKYDMQSRINGRRVTYMLVIRYLAEEDAGDYLCTIRIQGVQWPEWPKKIGKVTVQIAPQIQPSINYIYEKDIGSSLQLTCESHGNPYPNITWKREDGQELPMGGFQSRGATLNLTDIQRNDRGNYICVADNNVKPPDSFKVEVIVFSQPSCRPVQSTVGQAQNRRFNAKLECIVAGYPQPSMKWMKETENGKLIEIDDNDKYDITKQFSSQQQNDEFWYTLLVKNVQAKDYTNYHCVGTNKYGEGETNIVLFETMECQGFNCHYLDEILPERKQKGETGYLNCTVLKNKYCNVVQWSSARMNEIGNPKLISENETIIDQDMLSSEKAGLEKYDVQTLTNENKTSYMLVIRNISEVDAGEYYCSLTPQGQSNYICDQKTGILYMYINGTLYCHGTDCPSSSGSQMKHLMAILTLFLICMEHCIT